MKAIILAVALLASIPAGAVNRCDMPGGKVIFTDEPCPDGAKVKPVSAVVRPSEAEAGAAKAQSQRVLQQGDEASARVAKQQAADEEQAKLRKLREKLEADRAAALDAQRRQAEALERLSRGADNRPVVRDCYLSDPRCKP